MAVKKRPKPANGGRIGLSVGLATTSKRRIPPPTSQLLFEEARESVDFCVIAQYLDSRTESWPSRAERDVREILHSVAYAIGAGDAQMLRAVGQVAARAMDTCARKGGLDVKVHQVGTVFSGPLFPSTKTKEGRYLVKAITDGMREWSTICTTSYDVARLATVTVVSVLCTQCLALGSQAARLLPMQQEPGLMRDRLDSISRAVSRLLDRRFTRADWSNGRIVRPLVQAILVELGMPRQAARDAVDERKMRARGQRTK